MKDAEGVQLLQWCLPKLRMRWPGFRKVRRQVYKRIDRRLKELDLSDVASYRSYLERHQDEWSVLDALCRISISRCYRDKGVFQYLEREVLPQLAQRAAAKGENDVRCWSIGCASGEEPYTLAILWTLGVAPQFPTVSLRILGTDSDQKAIERAERACYPGSSIKDLPADLLAKAFIPSSDRFSVSAEYRALVTFREQDIRVTAPTDLFHLILCRNLAFTYFDDGLQRETLNTIEGKLHPGGALVIGSLESLPDGVSGFDPWLQKLGVYRKSVESGSS